MVLGDSIVLDIDVVDLALVAVGGSAVHQEMRLRVEVMRGMDSYIEGPGEREGKLLLRLGAQNVDLELRVIAIEPGDDGQTRSWRLRT